MKGPFWRSEASHRRVNGPHLKLLRHRTPDMTMATTRLLLALCACLYMATVRADIRGQHLGCYKDIATDRDLPVVVQDSHATTSFCIALCLKKGFKYTGLQNGNTCTCGNSYGKHGQASNGECNRMCSGDTTQVCGGALRNFIFATGFSNSSAEGQRRIGCFKDDNDRDLPVMIYSEKASQSFCLDICKTNQFKYMGLQYGSWCHCGNSYGKHGRASDSECNMKCSGNPKETCGAGYRNEIFTTGWTFQAKGWLAGCFKDTAADRDLPVVVQDSRASTTFCMNLCLEKGFKYTGLQNGNTCTCGNSYGKHGEASIDDCNLKCSGDSTQVCGGALRNFIFATGYRAQGQRIGCYKDTNDRDLPVMVFDNRVTSESCLDLCGRNQFKYMGLQYGTWCHCGNSYGKYGKASDSECNMKCSGESQETCGAGMRNEIFSTGVEN